VKYSVFSVQCSVVALVVFVASATGFAQEEKWSSFLGPGGASVSESVLPKVIDDQTGVAWKVELPAKGASSPIVVGDRVVTTCSGGVGKEKQDEMYVVCNDLATGKELWRQQFWATGRALCHRLSANAAPTPATDGQLIFAFFSSNDLACLDLDGNLEWCRGLAVDFPKAGNDVGMSSSPVVVDGVVVVQVECQGDSFAMGLNAADGTTKWTQQRGKKAVWASPTVLRPRDGKNLVLLQSADLVNVVDPQTGEVTFEQQGSCSTISTACVVDDTIFIPLDGTSAWSISSDGTITPKWNQGRIKAGSPSYQVNGDTIFTCDSKGILKAYDRETGETKKEVRVGGKYWSTPLIADGHMYAFDQEGELRIVNLHMNSDETKPEVVHQHKFEGEVFLGSPAIAGNALVMRSDRHLWKFAEKE